MNQTESVQITADQAGCWLESSNGWRNHFRAIDIAIECGMLVEGRDVVELERYRNGETDGCVGWMLDQGGLLDEATEYLSSRAPDGYLFEWVDGELFMSSIGEER